MFLCRNDRSQKASCLPPRLGHTKCYNNILEGFGDDIGATGHRGNVGGWRKAGLPWRS